MKKDRLEFIKYMMIISVIVIGAMLVYGVLEHKEAAPITHNPTSALWLGFLFICAGLCLGWMIHGVGFIVIGSYDCSKKVHITKEDED